MELVSIMLNNPWMRASAVVGLSILIALLCSLFVAKVLLRITQSTKTDIDDTVIQHLRRPLSLSIVLVGCWYAQLGLKPPQEVEHTVMGTLVSIAVLAWTVGLFRLSTTILRRLSLRDDGAKLIQPRTLPIFVFVAHAVVFGTAAYFFFLAWKIDVTGWLASAGIVGIAVGFAAKDTLANLFAGVFIMADAPYRIGDYLVLGSGDRGRVTHIGLRSTRIQTLDDVEVIIPNANIANSTIVNQSGGPNERARIRVTVSVAYDSDIDVVRDILLDIGVKSDHLVDDPAPLVRFREFGDSGLVFQLLGWVGKPEQHEAASDALNTEVFKRFQDDGIEIPFPKQDLYIKEAPSRLG